MLSLCLLAPSVLAQDYTSRVEFLGNPLTPRWGGSDSGAKVVNVLEPYEGRLMIGSGDTATNTRIDVWSFHLNRQSFDLEQRIRQELVVRFREFGGKLYINNEDLADTGANINIVDGKDWIRKDIRLPNNQPFDSFAAEHSRDVYLWQGHLLSSNGNRNNFPDIVISEDGGDSWRVAVGGPVFRTPGNGTSEETIHFMEVGGQLYTMPWSQDAPIYRFTPGGASDFVMVHPAFSGVGFPETPSNMFYQRRSAVRDGVFYVHSYNRFYKVSQIEPSLVIQEFNNFPGVSVNAGTVRVQDFHFFGDKLRVLVSQTITSGTNQYFNRARVFESADNGQSWTLLFSALAPGPRNLFSRFASHGDEFYFATNRDWTYEHTAGAPDRLVGTFGAIYRISLAATGRPRAEAVSFARVILSWQNQAEGALGWEIERLAEDEMTWLPVATVPVQTLSLEQTGLQAETTYTYRVRATYEGGSVSNWSGPAIATTGRAFLLAPEADAAIEGTTFRGAGATMNVKQHGNRKAYLRFDIRDLAEDLQHGELRVTFSTLDWASSDLSNGMNFRLYGLNPGTTAGGGKLGEDWPEMGINWDNAPANNTSSGTDLLTGSGTTNGGRAQLLLTVNVPSTTANGDTISLGGPALAAFINEARAAGAPAVTLALTRATGASGSNSVFATKENENTSAHPRLIVIPQSFSPPSQGPANLSLSSVSVASASLSWAPEAQNGITGYEIQRRSLPDGEWSTLGSVSEASEFQDGSVLSDQGYLYRVRTLTLLGPTPWTETLLAVTPQGLPYGQVAHWRFNETSGNTASDSSGQSRNLTFVSTPTWVDDAERGRVVNIGGSTQHAQVPNEPAFNAMSALTISFWVRPSNLNGTDPRFVISKRTSTTDGVFSIFFHTGNKLFVDLDSNNNRFGSQTTFANNTWYHIAVVYDGSLPPAERARLYVNGTLDTMANESSSVLNTNSAPVWVGQPSTNATSQFNGRLAGMRLHRHAFAPTEIQTLMQGSLPPSPPAFGSLERWRQAAFSTGELADASTSGPQAAPTGDGVANLLKYHLGLSPWEDASEFLPEPVLDETEQSLSIRYWRSRYAPNASAQPQWSENLSQWFTTNISERILTTDGQFEHVEITVPQGESPRIFLRLHVTPND